MNIKQYTIYVDGQPFEIECMMGDDDIMVPAYFFKYVGAEVNYNLKKTKVFLTVGCKTEEISNSSEKSYVSLQYIIKLFGMKTLYDPKTLRIYIITHTSPQQKPEILWRGDISEKKAALTFDDGPENYTTPKILDILNDKGVKATFFVVGKKAKAYPKVLERIVKEGHEVGNHTWSHADLTKLSTQEVIEEVKKTRDIVKSVTGVTTRFFRPPFGFMTYADLNTINSLGLKAVAWNIDTLDYAGASAEKIIDTIKRDISPGSIILQHSYNDSAHTLDSSIRALPFIIDQLRLQGMEFITIEELFSSK